MKVVLDIPDKWMKGFIKMQSNGSLFAYKEPGIDQPFHVTPNGCQQCGECCLYVGMDGPFGADDEGKCPKLVKMRDGKYECKAGKLFPAQCIMPARECEYVIFEEQSGK